jgi:hypothetical protein
MDLAIAVARKPSDCMSSTEKGQITEDHIAVAIEPVNRALRCIGKARRLSHFGNQGRIGESLWQREHGREDLPRGAVSRRLIINNMIRISRLDQYELGFINLTQVPGGGTRPPRTSRTQVEHVFTTNRHSLSLLRRGPGRAESPLNFATI